MSMLQGVNLPELRRRGTDVLLAGAFRFPAIAMNCAGVAMIAEGGLQIVGVTLALLQQGNPINLLNRLCTGVENKMGINIRPFRFKEASGTEENILDYVRVGMAVKLITKGIFISLISALIWDFSVAVFDKAPTGFYDNAMSLSPFKTKNNGGLILPYGRMFSRLSGN